MMRAIVHSYMYSKEEMTLMTSYRGRTRILAKTAHKGIKPLPKPFGLPRKGEGTVKRNTCYAF